MLADKKIVELIEAGRVKGIRKPENWYAEESPVQPSSLDLHIGGIYLPGATADQAGGEDHPLPEYQLNPGETVLMSTEETLDLPPSVAGIAFPPSRFAVKALLENRGGFSAHDIEQQC